MTTGGDVGAVLVGLGDDVGDSLGVSVGDDVSVGVAFPSLVPTFSAGGNGSTGSPARAAFIICCHVSAGRLPPNSSPPFTVTGRCRWVLPYQTAVDSCGVKPTNHA